MLKLFFNITVPETVNAKNLYLLSEFERFIVQRAASVENLQKYMETMNLLTVT